MNLPAQLTCLPSVAASCLPIDTRSILSPLITTVAFGSTLPSAGLITVAPTSETFSACALIASKTKKTVTLIQMPTRLMFYFLCDVHSNQTSNILHQTLVHSLDSGTAFSA